MGAVVDHLVHLSTDLADFERFLRLVQSLIHILSASPALLVLVLPFLSATNQPPSTLAVVAAATTALQLRNKVNLVRRTLRLFRFVGTFRSAGERFSAPSSAAGALASLEATSLSLLGVYGLLESATLLDLYDVPVFGPERAGALNAEAQRCWLVALGCAVVAGGMRVLGAGGPAQEKVVKDEKRAQGKDEKKVAKKESGEKARAGGQGKLMWAVMADGLDMTLPVSALGWAPGVEQWVVGSAMLTTTVVRMGCS